MNVRPTQTSSYQLVQAGLNLNFAKLVRAQEMVSSGKRILRPSDDPIGASTALALRRQLGDVGRYLGSVSSARPMLELATSALNDASGLLADAKQLVVSGMNGTLNDSDRAAIATQRQLVAAFPGNPKVPDALLNIATSQFELGDGAASRRTLEELIAKHPQSEAAVKARQRLAIR